MDTPPVPRPTHVRVNAEQIQITAPDGVDLADLAQHIAERLPQKYTPGGTIISGPVSVQPSPFTQIKDQIRSSDLSITEVGSLREELRTRSWEITNDLKPGTLSQPTTVTKDLPAPPAPRATPPWFPKSVYEGLAIDIDHPVLPSGPIASRGGIKFRQTDEPTIKNELTALLNRYSAESPSGTPDFILADLLIGVLREFNEAVSRRSEWRGESVELPSLQRQSENDPVDTATFGDPEPDPDLFKPPFSGRGLRPEAILGELAGAASMCWNPTPTGEFNPEFADSYVKDAVRALEEFYNADVTEKCDEGPMLVAGRVQTLRMPGHKRAAKLLKKAADQADAGNIDVAEQFRKLAEVRLQWGVK